MLNYHCYYHYIISTRLIAGDISRLMTVYVRTDPSMAGIGAGVFEFDVVFKTLSQSHLRKVVFRILDTRGGIKIAIEALKLRAKARMPNG